MLGQSSGCSRSFLSITCSSAGCPWIIHVPAVLIWFCYSNRILLRLSLLIFETRSHVVQANHKLQIYMRGWRDGSAVKSVCSVLTPGFHSKHSHGKSQPSVTAVPGESMPSSDLCRHHAHSWCTCLHASKTCMHVKIRQISLNVF